MRRTWKMLALSFAAWTLFGVLFALQSHLYTRFLSRPTPFTQALKVALVEYWFWALITPIVLLAARRFPVVPGKLWRHIPVHIAILLAISATYAAYRIPVFPYIYPGVAVPEAGLLFRRYLTGAIHNNVWMYVPLVALGHLVDYYRRYRDRELRTALLEMRLARTELQMLKVQLQPHFLFNTLHSIAALMHKDVATADRMISRLSDLLRMALDNVGVQEVTLKRELEFLGGYLEIEQTRFQDRMAVNIEVEPETLDACVPNMLLQPIVENAVKHGIAKRSAPGAIHIRARREDSFLRLEIEDDGPGISSQTGPNGKPGVGIANTRARLQGLYGPRHHFELRNLPGGGLVVVIKVPFKGEVSTAEPASLLTEPPALRPTPDEVHR